MCVHSFENQTSPNPHLPTRGAAGGGDAGGVEKQGGASHGRTRVSVEVVPAVEFSALVPELVDIYIAAMGYKPRVRANSVHTWRGNVRERGFVAVVAFADPAAGATGARRRPVGVAYGYFNRPEQWWDRELRRGIRQHYGAEVLGTPLFPAFKQDAAPGSLEERLPRILGSYLQLAEIHVHPAFQGLGIGAKLLSTLEKVQGADTIILSTPEVPGEDNRAFHLYRRFGYEDLLRHHYFLGDSRPFAVLMKQVC